MSIMDYKALFEELLGVRLKDNVPNQLVKCPFHDDKNPSMSVNIKTGLWYCFGCGEKGNIYQLANKLGYRIDEYGHVTNKEAPAPSKQTSNDKPKQTESKAKPYTVETYADEKSLPSDFLTKIFKLTDNPDKGCINIPYLDESGELLYTRYRSHGRKMWFDKGIVLDLYGLWLINDFDDDYIYIVEGESDTQTLVYNNIPAIGVPGANALNDEMLDKLEKFKTWIFVMENDEGGAKFIENAFKIINMFFPYRMATTYVVLMSDIELKDINDIWRITKRKEKFLRILDNISSIRVNLRVVYENYIKKGGGKMFDQNVRVVAKDLYSTLRCVYDNEGILWNYNAKKRVYEIVRNEDEFFKNIIISYGINKSQKITQTANQIKTFISNQMGIKQPGIEWIHFKNISVNYFTLETTRFDPQTHFISSLIPHNYLKNFERNEKIEKLFATWVDDPEMLFKLIGYTFIRGYPQNKIFILYGIGGNGKTTFLKILEQILNGPDKQFNQTASVSLKSILEDRFSASSLYGKLANLTGEMPYSKLTDTTALKDLSGNQKMQAQFKYGKQFEFTNYAKLVFATNKIPATSDTSGGWFRRIVIIHFKQIPQNQQDPHLLQKLTQSDYDYIVTRSLLALHELAKENYEFMPQEKVKQLYSNLSNPLRYFINTNCIITRSNNDWVESGRLIEKFKRWLQETNQPTMSWKEISEELSDMGLEKGRAKTFDGSQVRVIFGLRWSNETQNEPEEIPF